MNREKEILIAASIDGETSQEFVDGAKWADANPNPNREAVSGEIHYSKSDLKRFWSKVEITPECWNWKGACSKNGYGQFYLAGKHALAHRSSFEIRGEYLPSDMVVDHICKNKKCVNPIHLRIVTKQINTIENSESLPALNAAKDRCKNGHLFEEGNIYWHGPKKDKRECLICKKEKRKLRWKNYGT